MKRILVPVDFSASSLNAMNYAAEMALYTDSKLILLHVYNNLPPALDIPIVIPSDEIESNMLQRLATFAKDIEHKFGEKLVVKSDVRQGFVVEEVNSFAESEDVEMIIMGMQGAGYLVERLVGSTTSMVIRKSKKPVLVVGDNMKFRNLKKILLATDGERIAHEASWKPLKNLLSRFKAHLYVLHVIPEIAYADMYDDLDAFKLDEEWMAQSMSFHHSTHENTTTGINNFIQELGVDMLVMVPHKHNLWERIIEEPQTQKMVFHSVVPMLTLPE